MFKIFLMLFLLLLSPVLKAQVVEVYAKDTSPMLNLPIQGLRLHRVKKDNTLQVIPFQIDEKVSKEGKQRTWAFQSYQEGKTKDLADGLWQADEPLLFVVSDSGGPWKGEKPDGLQQFWELALKDGSYVYLSYSKKPQGLSPKNYLNYDPKKDTVGTELYEVGFHPKYPLVQNKLLFKKAVMPKNILDRFKVRLDLVIKGFFDFKVNEEELKSKRIGYQVGPIRVLRRVRAWKSLGPIKLIPSSMIDYYYYPSWVEMPTQVDNPLDGPSRLDPKTQGVMGMDFRSIAGGSLIRSNGQSQPYILSFQSAKDEPVELNKNLTWFSVSGLAGSMVLSLDNDPRFKALNIKPSLQVIVSKEKHKPEEEFGQLLVGFSLPFHKIPKGRYRLKMKQVFEENLKPGQETLALSKARLVPFRGVARAL